MDELINELTKRLNSLEISVAEQEDGKLTVFTTVEPLFCFVRDTEAQALQVVKETLESYARHFYKKEATIKLEVQPTALVRQVRLEPRRRVYPIFSTPINDECVAFA